MSVVVAITLVACLFVSTTLEISHVSKEHLARSVTVWCGGGQMALSFGTGSPTTRRPGFHVNGLFPRIRMPDAKLSTRAFGADWLSLMVGGDIFMLQFPVWITVLPCCIAPVAWERRRRRSTARGFAVLNPK